jgi:hypothetical protein
MSSFKPTQNRFSSLKEDVNTFSSSNPNRDTNSKSFEHYRDSRSRDSRDSRSRDSRDSRDTRSRDSRDSRERYDTRRGSYKETRQFTARDTNPKPKEFNINEELFPSINKEVIETEKKVVYEVSDYLKKCAKTKEDAEKIKSEEGWITIRYDKKTHKITYTRNGASFFPTEYYEERQKELREQEYQADMEKLAINNIKRYDDLIREEYELYGDDSIAYQEHCRFQQSLIDYPEVDDDNVIENDGSDYDSNEEY